jgi:hypothetical protein
MLSLSEYFYLTEVKLLPIWFTKAFCKSCASSNKHYIEYFCEGAVSEVVLGRVFPESLRQAHHHSGKFFGYLPMPGIKCKSADLACLYRRTG